MQENIVITINRITEDGMELVFDTSHFCGDCQELVHEVYQRLQKAFPPPEFDVVLTKWTQTITLLDHSLGGKDTTDP